MTNEHALFFFFLAFALGGLVGPLAGGYLFSAVGFFNMCVIIGCFLLACCPYVYIYTGPRGKFIVRAADREKSAKIDEEIILNKDTVEVVNAPKKKNITI